MMVLPRAPKPQVVQRWARAAGGVVNLGLVDSVVPDPREPWVDHADLLAADLDRVFL